MFVVSFDIEMKAYRFHVHELNSVDPGNNRFSCFTKLVLRKFLLFGSNLVSKGCKKIEMKLTESFREANQNLEIHENPCMSSIGFC